MTNYEKQYEDCYVTLTEGKLSIGNRTLERVWDMGRDIPTVESLRNKNTGKQWISISDNQDWLEYPEEKYAFYKKGITDGARRSLRVHAETDDDCGIGRKALRAVVSLEYDRFLVEWIHLIYPGTPVLRSMMQVTRKEGITIQEEAEACEWKGVVFNAEELSDDFYDSFPVVPRHCEWENVKFIDYTDDNDNLVECIHGILTRREFRYMYGNILLVTDVLEGEGITFIKEGPTPCSYLGDTKSDFYVKGKNVFTTGWGLEERDFRKAKTITGYGGAIVLWDTDVQNKYLSLNRYHRVRHDFIPERDAFLMSNTWGDMSSDGKISESFLLDELKRAKEIGINLYQIDDGWQKGTTANSVNANAPGFDAAWGEGYYKADPGFWSVNDTRLPNGLEPVAAYARENGIRLGLWFSPDSDNEFENWERDAGVLLDLHKKYGIAAFKIDGVRLTSKVSEDNLTKLLQRVVTESDGALFFNMDVTAGTRSGFFGRVQYGSLFVENRFTGRFGPYPNYFPHRTLRNLWMLSRYYPANRLQMEFVNVKRNAELYGDDPLAPACCGLEYSFAVTMFANPLAWMELTGLDKESADLLHDIIPAYQKIQGDILAGRILPVGEEPNGTKWTGFQSLRAEGEGYLLLIKEYNDMSSYSYTLWKERDKKLKLERLLGYGKQQEVETDQEGRAVFELAGKFTYVVYKYSAL